MKRKPNLFKLILQLQKAHSHNLGFLPKQAIEQYIERQQVNIATLNDEACGYILWRDRSKPLWFESETHERTILQACIATDARRRQRCTEALRQLAFEAISAGKTTLALWSGSTLESNQFWRDVGFQVTGRRIGSVHHHPVHLRWSLDLTLTTPEQIGTPAPARNSLYIPPWFPSGRSRHRIPRMWLHGTA